MHKMDTKIICSVQDEHHFDPDTNISTTIGCSAMTLCTDIHGPQLMNPDFSSVVTSRLIFVIFKGNHDNHRIDCLENLHSCSPRDESERSVCGI